MEYGTGGGRISVKEPSSARDPLGLDKRRATFRLALRGVLSCGEYWERSLFFSRGLFLGRLGVGVVGKLSSEDWVTGDFGLGATEDDLFLGERIIGDLCPFVGRLLGVGVNFCLDNGADVFCTAPSWWYTSPAQASAIDTPAGGVKEARAPFF